MLFNAAFRPIQHLTEHTGAHVLGHDPGQVGAGGGAGAGMG